MKVITAPILSERYQFNGSFTPEFLADVRAMLSMKYKGMSALDSTRRLVRSIRITGRDFGDYASELAQLVNDPLFTQVCLERSNMEYRQRKFHVENRLKKLEKAIDILEKNSGLTEIVTAISESSGDDRISEGTVRRDETVIPFRNHANNS